MSGDAELLVQITFKVLYKLFHEIKDSWAKPFGLSTLFNPLCVCEVETREDSGNVLQMLLIKMFVCEMTLNTSFLEEFIIVTFRDFLFSRN